MDIPSLLKEKKNLYYAGLDDKGLPFGESLKFIVQSSKKNITYLKAESLFVDHIIIPPTFLFYCIPSDKKESWDFYREISSLFVGKYLVTSVYGGINRTSDFLSLKIEKGEPEEINLILNKMTILRSLFDSIPLLCRDVEEQSSAFKQKFISSIDSAPDSRLDQGTKETLLDLIEDNEKVGGIALSRYRTILLLNNLRREGKINEGIYQEIYYRMNSSYYIQGAETYFANISCLNSPKYPILIRGSLETESSKILIAYDPELILSILRAHNINEGHINKMTVSDIERIKESNSFRVFRDRYQKFAESLQKCLNGVDEISKTNLIKLDQKIIEQFQQEYLIGRKLSDKMKSRYSILENMFFSTATGILGYLLGGPLGAMLGAVPVILQVSRITPRISDLIIDRIGNHEKAFYEYVKIIDKVSSDLEKEKMNR